MIYKTKMELIELSKFITERDNLFPKASDCQETQEIVRKKYRDIVAYNKFLETDLRIDMFEGDTKIFDGGGYVNNQPSTNWNYYEIAGTKIFMDSNECINRSMGKKVKDLTGKGILIVGYFNFNT